MAKKFYLSKGIIIVLILLVIANLFVLIKESGFILAKTKKKASTNSSAMLPIYYSYHISDKMDKQNGPFTSNNHHPLLSVAIIATKWSKIQQIPNEFDWDLLDEKINQWIDGGDKKIILKISPYGQNPEGGKDHSEDNDTTPNWVYDTVPRINFIGGGKRKVSVPKVWDENFYPVYEQFIKGLAEKYDNDRRVAGFIIGIGQNGTILGQGSKNGGKAFEKAGWTLSLWETHTKRVLSLAEKYFDKPLYIIKTSAFLNNYNIEDNFDVAKRVIGGAALQGISVLFRGLDQDEKKYQRAFNPELVTYLGSLRLPKDFTLGFFDDWPLWVPPSRSECEKGPTCGRDLAGFEKELQYALDAWKSIDRKYPLFFIFQEPEMTATNPKVPSCTSGSNLEDCFYQPLYDMTKKYLSQ
jgi:hypothetical protein